MWRYVWYLFTCIAYYTYFFLHTFYNNKKTIQVCLGIFSPLPAMWDSYRTFKKGFLVHVGQDQEISKKLSWCLWRELESQQSFSAVLDGNRKSKQSFPLFGNWKTMHSRRKIFWKRNSCSCLAWACWQCT